MKRRRELPPPMPGARVSVFPSPRGEAQFRVHYLTNTNERVRITVGSKDETEAAAAKLRLESFRVRALGEPQRRSSLSFPALQKMQLSRGVDKDSIAHDRSRWKLLQKYFAEVAKIDSVIEVRPSDVDGLRLWLREQPFVRPRKTPRPLGVPVKKLSKGTANRYLALLRAAINLAIEDGYLSENPVRKTHFFKEKPRKRIATPNEMLKLCETAGRARRRPMRSGRLRLTRADPELRLAIVLAFETALREESICSIEVEHIDFERKEIFIPDTKNDDPLQLPLSSHALHALRERVAIVKKGRLFSVNGNVIGKRFARLVRELEIKDLRFHDLRATAATRMLRAGVNIKTLMRLGGWRSISSVMRYLKIDTSDLRSAIALVENSAET